ncbi:Nitrite transporter NirC [Jeotgalicoccus saudimassiliensis]|uniref:Nitrite transporter NirC n=1 Tax=Jeotgalicoccus saudimassiliensis TaxID=1461582 RepID=A0A078MCF3_9STAP|nr:formate/nitrite transporter family protein [Jeotgalicoccus saudimassiliensis]CEA02406.1 Nitrite transporter NirC [Jeotgalicoccus saudimassiliensis]
MYRETIETMSGNARNKQKFYEDSRMKFFVSSMLAGAYIGVGCIVLFFMGGPLFAVESPFVNLITGITFGVALAIVIWAGSDLFTGNVMTFTFGALMKKITWKQTTVLLIWCYIGNLIGALLFSYFIYLSGIFPEINMDSYTVYTAAGKMNDGFTALLFQGIMCNWLVCLAIWTAARANNEMTKLSLIFVLIFAFVAVGFEHSIANMTIMAVALLHSSVDTVTVGGFVYNLIPVTIGNIIGGGFFVACIYYYLNGGYKEKI